MQPLPHLLLAMPLICWPWVAAADVGLATSKNCMGCHAMEKKLIGPSYKDIASKYKGQKDAESYLQGKILKGGTGVWGNMAMPASANVSDAEARKLAAWILAL